MNEFTEFNVSKALVYLKDGYVVSTIVETKKIYFVLKKDKIIVQSPLTKYSVSESDFIHIYEGLIFSLVQDEEESVDLKKDEEYYSWRNK